ncbi:hypothetical protein BI49514_00409 [Brevibacterium iodinum ATCC 49514]|uniref:Uncharacterized protein n=1 Tax=Brevibacterium iodinum ATCC 49514 TaxID=1255616 RepID=A0A2H1HW99_9MICO|nr:hypothetical protein [Brevibacterium iodinum]SMX67199.1 hypothetical protein BI49514_00409 [Brevibacterium iodinum ATCC 49514]SUW13693.1 Uncharacterised protein [Brevibacterium iodinum]
MAQQAVDEPLLGLIAAEVEKLHVIEVDLADVRGELRIGLRDGITQLTDTPGA